MAASDLPTNSVASRRCRTGPDLMHRRILVIVVLALAAVVAVRLSALYEIPRTREVPVARLVANLERDLKADPRNIELQISLARLHGMAYALKTEVVAAHPGPVNGKSRSSVSSRSDSLQAGARAHFGGRDRRARASEEGHLALRGCVDARSEEPDRAARVRVGARSSGERTRAIGEYRRVIKEAWVTEETAFRALPETRFFTAEAAGYLIPLLEPARDADEIADLRGKEKTARRQASACHYAAGDSARR